MSWLAMEEDEDLLDMGDESIEFQDMELLVDASDTLWGRKAMMDGS